MLNDAEIKAAKPAEKPYRRTNSGQLSLQVSPQGGKLWRMNYTFGAEAKGKPRQKTLAFGSYPDTTLLTAREKRDAKKLLRDGKDPAVEKCVAVESSAAANENTSLSRSAGHRQIAACGQTLAMIFSTASGSAMIIDSSTRAGASGDRRSCSQSRNVPIGSL